MGTALAEDKFLAVKLISREEVAEGTMAFRFQKPSNWTYKAGQSLDMTLLNPPETDAEGNTRAFSLASAPQEDFLMIATRMRDTAFKRTLKALPIGAEVKIEGPFGNLTLHNKATRAASESLRSGAWLCAPRGKSCRTAFFCSTETAGRRMPRSSMNSVRWKGTIRITN